MDVEHQSPPKPLPQSVADRRRSPPARRRLSRQQDSPDVPGRSVIVSFRCRITTSARVKFGPALGGSRHPERILDDEAASHSKRTDLSICGRVLLLDQLAGTKKP